jgi:hypothetical protein
MNKHQKIVIGVLAFAQLGGAYFLITSPVLFRFRDPTNVNPELGVTLILNPLRNKEPEQSAEQFLSSLKSGLCKDAFAAMPIQEEGKSAWIEEEQAHPLKDWIMTNRVHNRGKIELVYLVRRDDYDFYGSGITLYLEKQDSNWRVTEFVAYY